MPVRVDPGLGRRIRENPGGIALQVQGASDADAAADALRIARSDISRLDGGWESAAGLSPGDSNGPTYLSPVVPSPTGPVIYVDGGSTPVSVLETIPGLVSRRLRDAGVQEALIAWTSDQGPTTQTLYDEGRRAVVLRLYAPPPPLVPLGQRQPLARAPATWYEEAVGWVRGALGEDELLWAAAGPVGYPVPVSDAVKHFERSRRAGSALLMAGDMASRLRAADTSFAWHQTLTLGGGGAQTSDEDLVAVAESLVELARRLAPSVSYAHIDIQQSFHAMSRSYMVVDRLRPPQYPDFDTAATPDQVQLLSADLVQDGFGYQILGPGHLGRLGDRLSRPPEDVRVRELERDRIEVTVGEIEWWLPDHPQRSHAQAIARRLLAPCLHTSSEARALYFKKIGQEDPSLMTSPAPPKGYDPDRSG